MPQVGERLGRYRIEEQIGAGGMGVVYRAYDEKLQRRLAIKVITPGALNDEAARKRFRNEALILSRLNHPSIQTIHDFDSFDGHDYLVSELVPGSSLDVRLSAGALPEKEAIQFGIQLAQGLAAAHAAGVLHRDLKPSNLRVTPDGLLKILDFGLATLSREAVLTLSATQSVETAPTGVAGTLPYMSPEQLLGEQVDERSDVYSAGIVLFELASGRLPFAEPLVTRLTDAILHQSPPELRSLAPKYSMEFERIVARCLEKDPELRYQSAKELAAELKRLQMKSSAPSLAAPSRNHKRYWPWAIAAVTAFLILIAAILWWRPAKQDDALPSVRWEQLTNFNDFAEAPAVSRDGKLVAFLRSAGTFGLSASAGQVWIKTLPEGQPYQLTDSQFRKQTLDFSPDGTRLYFTQVEGPFAWNTYELPLLGAREPKLWMPNASGLHWIGNDRLLFSQIATGVHMQLVTSNLSRSDLRDVYVPSDHRYGMAHRSALSPDGKWVLLVEMDDQWWRRCRLVPFDGSSPGQSVGPEGSCTWAQWSPDGKWMYFTVDTRTTGFHVWRQRFPAGAPQQLTPSGASEEEGLAMTPDGKSLITTSGVQQSTIWLHDGKAGERQVSSEGFSFDPSLSPDGKRMYCLRRPANPHSYFSGELWMTDLATGTEQQLFPGLVLTHFSISQDGEKVVFATEQGQERSGIWIGWLDGAQPPRQLTFGGEFRAFFGKRGEIIYQGNQRPLKIMRMREDGSGQQPASEMNIMALNSVSPDGRWALIGATPESRRPGERNTENIAVPLDGGKPLQICGTCTIGFGTVRMFAPLISWSADGKWVYVPLRYFSFGSTKTAAIPMKAGAPPPAFADSKTANETYLTRIYGARIIGHDDIASALSPERFVYTQRTAKANLFRIYLEPSR
ncbi:MAG: protein kinase domain-containing protein [Terriglobales bacterium]